MDFMGGDSRTMLGLDDAQQFGVIRLGFGMLATKTPEQATGRPAVERRKASRRPHAQFRARLLTVVGFVFLWVAAMQSLRMSAQEFRASITGQVADPTGALIPGASITAVNSATRVAYSAKSNNQGAYSVLYILPGSYTVTVNAVGFQTMVYHNVVLDTAQQLGLNVTLKPGNVSQEVVVSVGALELDTVSATTGGVIDQAKVENMPSAGLDVWDDVTLTQGISSNSTGVFNLTLRNSGNRYTVSGDQTDENAFYMNGVPVSYGAAWHFSPNQGAVEQVQAYALPYDAQYGRTGGGVFTTNLKTGTNSYHGVIYDYFGNRALNANTSIGNLSGLPNPVNTRNTWGIESSGPIIKGKAFYMGSYEGFHQIEPGTPKDTVPTAAERNGDFSGTGYTIYDPLSTYCAKKNSSGGCTTYARKPFPNDLIPSSRFSSIGQAILAMYPAQIQAGLVNNYVILSPTTYDYRQYIGRVDQSFSDNTRMYVMYARQTDFDYTSGNGFTNAAYSGAIQNPTTDYNAIVDLTHIFSASKMMDLKAAYWHDAGVTTHGNAIGKNFLASNLGFNMPMVGSTSHQNIVPVMTITGATPLFGNTESGTMDALADFAGSVTQLLGRHSLHYGVEFMDVQSAPIGVLGQPNGAFTFNPSFTQGNPLKAATGQGNSFADVLLGYPSSGTVTWQEPTFVTVHYYGAFIQDSYRVFPKLTVDLGVRWDVNKTPRDRHNRINDGFCLTCTNPYTAQTNYGVAPGLQNPLLGGLLFAGVNGAPSEPYKVQWNDWQPRVGFSWAPLSSTVIRGGFGIYFPWETMDVDTYGFSQSTPFVASLDGNLTPDNYLNSGMPYPDGAIAPAGASGGLATNAGNSINYDNTQRRLRVTQHWSLGIQRSLPWSLLLDVEYLGTNVHYIPVSTSLDIIPTSLQQSCNQDTSICNTNVANPFFGVLATNTALGASQTIPAWELMRAYPLFNGLTEGRVPSGGSHYNALEGRVERRVKSLNFIFDYTYSNWMDQDEYLNNGKFRDDHLTRALDPADRRNFLKVNMVYPLPGTTRNLLLSGLTNHWLFDSTVMWGTGNPLPLPSADFLWGTSGCDSYAPVGGQTRAHWLNNNESCWTDLGPWEPRTTPLRIGFIRDPSFVVWNPALSKQFTLPHEMSARFRMEALNGANHPTWGAPSTAVDTPPKFTPSTNWTGFGTLPTSSSHVQRQIIASLKILF